MTEQDTEYWIRTESDRKAVSEGCYFDYNKANRVRDFFRTFLRHCKGEFAGSPFELMDWQWERVIGPAFGWMNADGSRRFRECELWIPKKNGKSTLAAAIALYLLCADNEFGSEVYSAAGDRNQAGIVYREAVAMVKMAAGLEGYLSVKNTQKVITFNRRNSRYEVLTAEGYRNEGYNIHGLVFDELHTQRNRKLWAALKYGGIARKQPIRFVLSTAGEYDEQSLWWERFNYCKKVQSGEIVNTRLLPCVYAADDSDDPFIEDTWKKCNPSYGITISAESFHSDAESARLSPTELMEFLRYRLNRATQHKTQWVSYTVWNQCQETNYRNDNRLSKKEGRVKPVEWFAAVDLADSVDMVAAVFGGNVPGEGFADCKDRVYIEPYFWLPEHAGIHSNTGNRARYERWAQDGHLRIIPGPVIDQEEVENQLISIMDKRRVVEIGIDKWNAVRFAYDMQKKLSEREKKTKIRLVGYNAATMNEPTRILESLLISGRIIVKSNPIFSWMLGNVKATIDSNGNRKLDKSGGSNGKIDAFSAACIMIYCMITKDPEFISRYENHGLTIV